MIELAEAKAFLRIDSDAEDALITNTIKAAGELVESVLRFPLSDYEGEVPELVRQTTLYTLGQLYEGRDDLDIRKLLDTIARILFAHRKGAF